MAYPNSPGGLPNGLYTDMSSMHISSPRAGRANASPYLQMPYLVSSAENPCMSLPPDLYNGMSSMHVSSPFPSQANLPLDGRTTLEQPPVGQTFDGQYYPSGHMDMHSPYYEYQSTSGQAAQRQDREPMMKALKDASRPSQKDIRQPVSVIGNMPRVITTEIGCVKTEDIEADEMDWFDINFPESSRRGLQAVLDEKKARDDEDDKKAAEYALALEKYLEKRPNDPTLLKWREQDQISSRELQYFRDFNREAMINEWQWREKERAKKAHRQGR
ncbi:hypothetical protein DENSPDRAFT_933087 [Dentipellis sp. KUC8613]|nr:hypothetical protein DENSPDRAFT_933087 [Dentipellis sp. KUC8613]